jgi:hypothetical protein
MSLPLLATVPDEELAEWRADAKDKTSCLQWLHRCDAACCSQFSVVDIGQDLTQKTFVMKGGSTPSMLKYYELHGCTYRWPYMHIPTRKAVRRDGRIYILERCKYLKDRKCIAHGTNRQPAVCRDFNLKSVLEGTTTYGARTIDVCLFRFKKEELEGAQHEEDKTRSR